MNHTFAFTLGVITITYYFIMPVESTLAMLKKKLSYSKYLPLEVKPVQLKSPFLLIWWKAFWNIWTLQKLSKYRKLIRCPTAREDNLGSSNSEFTPYSKFCFNLCYTFYLQPYSEVRPRIVWIVPGTILHLFGNKSTSY